MEYVKSDLEDSASEEFILLKPFSKNTALFGEKYILDLMYFPRGIIENWSRK